MINLSAISSKSFLGKILRFFANLIPAGAIIKIKQGPLRGHKWIKGSGVNGYWLGTYESENQKEFLKHVKPGYSVLDAGANVGFYTILFSKLVGLGGRVVAFEPSQINYNFLEKHVNMNSCKNVQIVKLAVGNKEGQGFLDASGPMSHIREEGEEIYITTIDKWCEENNFAPNFIKLDVEGFEYKALVGAENTIKKYSPVIAISFGLEERPQYVSFFEKLGYEVGFTKSFGHIDTIIATKK